MLSRSSSWNDQSQQCVNICKQLLAYPQDASFWHWIVMGRGMKNGSIFVILIREISGFIPARIQNLLSKMGGLNRSCVFDGISKEVLHFESVPYSHVVNVDLYAQQLQCIYNTLKTHYPALVNWRHTLLQNDNDPANTANMTKCKLEKLEVLLQLFFFFFF